MCGMPELDLAVVVNRDHVTEIFETRQSYMFSEELLRQQTLHSFNVGTEVGVCCVSVNQWFKQLLCRQNEEAGMSREGWRTNCFGC